MVETQQNLRTQRSSTTPARQSNGRLDPSRRARILLFHAWLSSATSRKGTVNQLDAKFDLLASTIVEESEQQKFPLLTALKKRWFELPSIHRGSLCYLNRSQVWWFASCWRASITHPSHIFTTHVNTTLLELSASATVSFPWFRQHQRVVWLLAMHQMR
jgi:hypothetical protein